MKKTTYYLILNFFLITLLSHSTFANTYYVDKDNKFGNGSHNNWPGTIDKPKNNLQGSWFQYDLKPGDTVIVRQASSYGEIRFYSSSSGTPENPIVVMAYPGESIILDSNVVPSQFGFRLMNGASDIHMIGPFEVSNKDYSFAALGQNTGLLLENITITNCNHGPRLSGTSDSVFKNIDISYMAVNGFQLRGSESAATGEPCRNLIIENVIVHDVDDGKTPDNSEADGFHSYGGENILFKNCSTWNNAEDGFDLNSNAVLVNCLSYNNKASGLKAWRRAGDNYAEKTVTAINSIFHNNGYHEVDTNPGIKVTMGAGLNLYNSIVSSNYDQGVNLRMKLTGSQADPLLDLGLSYQTVKIHNTIVNNTINGAGIRDGGALLGIPLLESSDHNLLFDNLIDAEGFTVGSNSIVGLDPLFFDVDNLDFHLNANSPAIDSGIDISSMDDNYANYGLLDMEGNARPNGSAIDIGPYETSTTLSNEVILLNSQKLYPNPTYGKVFLDHLGRNLKYDVFTLSGKLIQTGLVTSDGVDLKELSAGTYIFRVKNKKGANKFLIVKY